MKTNIELSHSLGRLLPLPPGYVEILLPATKQSFQFAKITSQHKLPITNVLQGSGSDLVPPEAETL
jgi:hypothetical protein